MYRLLPLVINSLYVRYIQINNKYKIIWNSINKNKLMYLKNIEIPFLKQWFIISIMVIFLEVVRELPITLLLKPFNFDTLSTKIFYYANAEMIYSISPYVLVIVLISIIPIIYLSKSKYDIWNK